MRTIAWHRTPNDFHRSPEVRELRLRLKNPCADAYMQRLWSHLTMHRISGEIRGFDPVGEIEDAIDWEGERGAFVESALASDCIQAVEGGFICRRWQEENANAIAQTMKKNSRPNARQRQRIADRRLREAEGRVEPEQQQLPDLARATLRPVEPDVRPEPPPLGDTPPATMAPIHELHRLYREFFPDTQSLFTQDQKVLATKALEHHSVEDWRPRLENLAGAVYWKGCPFEKMFMAAKLEEHFQRGAVREKGWTNPRPRPAVVISSNDPDPRKGKTPEELQAIRDANRPAFSDEKKTATG